MFLTICNIHSFLGSTLNPSIRLLKTSLMSTPTKYNEMESNQTSTYVRPETNYYTEKNEVKTGYLAQPHEEPYYNKMVKRPTPKQGKNSSANKENWNSLYSDVDCTRKSNCNPSYYGISPQQSVNYDVSEDNCSIPNDFDLDPKSYRHNIGVDGGHAKVPWSECESSNSNVVDITHWIMNTLGSAIKLRFLDLAGLETYISQIILLIKLITTTSGIKNLDHDASITSSMLAIPSASSAEPSRNVLDRQTKVYDRNGFCLKEKRFSDIVGVIKGKKQLKNNQTNG